MLKLSFNNTIKKIRDIIDLKLSNIYLEGPENMTETANFVMSAKGKRIRPILTLLTSKSLYGEYNKSYQAAIAIEMLHNFTLIHDDIMDNDFIRHGQKLYMKNGMFQMQYYQGI